MGRFRRFASALVIASVPVLGLAGLSTAAHAGIGPGFVTLSVNDVSRSEGNAGPTPFTFNVRLSGPAPAGGVTFDIATANGTATAPSDFTAQSLTNQTIPAGSTVFTFIVLVNGDTTVEPDETFFVNVTNVVGFAVFVSDGQGMGTILNDDVAAYPLNVSPSGLVDPTPALIAGAGSPTVSSGGATASFGPPVAGLASLLLLQVFIARRFLRRRQTVR